jgi:DNA-binding NarL/FixJ family response regulator
MQTTKCHVGFVNTAYCLAIGLKAFICNAKKIIVLSYILKDDPFKELYNCIQSISKGMPYFSSTSNNVFEDEVENNEIIVTIRVHCCTLDRLR